MTPQPLDLGPDGDGRHRLTRLLDFTTAGAEDGWIVAGLRAIETGGEVFVWAGVCRVGADTHVVLYGNDPGEVLNATFDPIVGKEPPFRLCVAPEKGRDTFAVCFLWSVGEDKIHVQRKASASVTGFLR